MSPRSYVGAAENLQYRHAAPQKYNNNRSYAGVVVGSVPPAEAKSEIIARAKACGGFCASGMISMLNRAGFDRAYLAAAEEILESYAWRIRAGRDIAQTMNAGAPCPACDPRRPDDFCPLCDGTGTLTRAGAVKERDNLFRKDLLLSEDYDHLRWAIRSYCKQHGLPNFQREISTFLGCAE